MRLRIEAHRKARPAGWSLVEEPLMVAQALRAAGRTAGSVVVDCVTIWISNLLLADPGFGETEAAARAQALADAAGKHRRG